eukprot:3112825-Rhodomonas_salina.1
MLIPCVMPCGPSVDGYICLRCLRCVGCGVQVESVSLESSSSSDLLDCEFVEPGSLVIEKAADCRREDSGDTVVESVADSGRGATPQGDGGGVPYSFPTGVVTNTGDRGRVGVALEPGLGSVGDAPADMRVVAFVFCR